MLRPKRDAVNRQNNFNLLRFIFASLVILSHSFPLIYGDNKREILTRIDGNHTFGEIALYGFFLLSGFLIIQSWDRNPQFLDFIKKRVLRIYPGFIAASLVSVYFFAPLGVESVSNYFALFDEKRFAKEMILLRNPSSPPIFAGLPFPTLNGSMWTIEYEFRCYLLVAFFGICGLFKWRSLWILLFGISLVVSLFPAIINIVTTQFTSRALFYSIGDRPENFAVFLAYFCAGGCFYLFRDRIQYKKPWLVVSSLIVLASTFDRESSLISFPIFGAYLLFWFAFAPIPFLDRFRKYPDISYGVYLYAWPIQRLFIWYFPSISPGLLFLLAWVSSCTFGWLSWHLVERPFLRFKPKPSVKVDDPAQSNSKSESAFAA